MPLKSAASAYPVPSHSQQQQHEIYDMKPTTVTIRKTRHKDKVHSRAPKPLPDATFLRECFDYNSITGDLTWRSRPRHHFVSERWMKTFNTRCSGRVAGTMQSGGIVVGIDNKNHLAHRLIVTMLGGDCSNLIDHIDGNFYNNSASNLRPATRTQNNANRTRSVINKSGYIGVSKVKNKKLWAAEVRHGGSRVHQSYHKTPQEASEAYQMKAREYHGQFVRQQNQAA